MCVIILQPEGTHLDKETAQRCWDRNPDGGGFSFINNYNEIVIEKHMSFPAYWRAFETARSTNPRRDFLLHMRVATHGGVTLDNVHPFRVDHYGQETVMAHNGIIHGVPDDPTDQDRSDTRMFIDTVLPYLQPEWLDSEEMVDMMDQWLGWSKLAFLTTSPDLVNTWYIVNEASGTWHQGMWFSNDSFKESWTKKKKTTTYKGTGSVQRPLTLPSYKETTEDWERWAEELPVQVNLKQKVESNLKKARLESLLLAEIYYDEWEDRWECWGCERTVHDITGECECWNRICVACRHFAAECECPEGYSQLLVDFDRADIALQAVAQIDTANPQQ